MVSGNKNNARKSICPLQKKRKKKTRMQLVLGASTQNYKSYIV